MSIKRNEVQIIVDKQFWSMLKKMKTDFETSQGRISMPDFTSKISKKFKQTEEDIFDLFKIF